jgi:hypothetical protein
VEILFKILDGLENVFPLIYHDEQHDFDKAHSSVAYLLALNLFMNTRLFPRTCTRRSFQFFIGTEIACTKSACLVG